MDNQTTDKVLETIKKLLARSKNNPYEAEAQTCLLKAQKLMAEHKVSVEQVGDKTIEYAQEVATTKWNMGFRKPLARVIANNFRCEIFVYNNNYVFLGHSLDARIAREAYEFAYDFAMREGNRLYNKAYSAGLPTKGVFNSYAVGFIQGLKCKLDEQTTALAIRTPPDVTDKFEEITEGWKTKKAAMRTGRLNRDAYDKGLQDGRTVMNGKRLEGEY